MASLTYTTSSLARNIYMLSGGVPHCAMRSFIKTLNISDPSFDPWGIPLEIDCQEETVSPSFTRC